VGTLLNDAELPHRAAWEVGTMALTGERKAYVRQRGNDPEEAFLHSVQENIPLLKQREQNSALKHPAGLLLIAITHNDTNAHRE
jgi:hypothetical protein